jgi:hypothetical protein
MRIHRYTSAADNCSAPDDDSQPDQYSATTNRNAFTHGHIHACAEIRTRADREL